MPSEFEHVPNAVDHRHFEFGANWQKFLATIDDSRIVAAESSLESLLSSTNINGKTFLDAGCGSGLFSLAASRLGAKVTSFDLDLDAVACAKHLKKTRRADSEWEILNGSLTDPSFLESLGQHDIVYCWGVVHHTGLMWTCLGHLLKNVGEEGTIIVAVYNDQIFVSRVWTVIKRIYQKLPKFLRPIYVFLVGATTFLKRLVATLLSSLFRLATLTNPLIPFANWKRESRKRGMHVWHDLVDWVGGWPFEVARPEEVFRFARDRGFRMVEMKTCVGHGCNEFVFQRNGTVL